MDKGYSCSGCVAHILKGLLLVFENIRCVDFIRQIFPFLKVKRMQAEIALKYLETVKTSNHRKKLVPQIIREEKISAMNC